MASMPQLNMPRFMVSAMPKCMRKPPMAHTGHQRVSIKNGVSSIAMVAQDPMRNKGCTAYQAAGSRFEASGSVRMRYSGE